MNQNDALLEPDVSLEWLMSDQRWIDEEVSYVDAHC
jgi:hypothetical protein